MHKKILEKCGTALAKDAKHYAKDAKKASGVKKKHDMIEMKEAAGAAKAIKKRAKKAHEY